MIQRIQELEVTSRILEPEQEQRQSWNEQMLAYSNTFLDQIESLNAYDTPNSTGVALKALDFKEYGRAFEEILPVFQKEVDRQGINPASGGHLGYIPGGGVMATAIGDFLASITNRYSGIFFANPGAVRIENILLRWMCKMVGFPENALGNLTSGGSIANLIAVTTARDAKNIGPKNVERSVIYLTEQVHHCVQKAIRIAGLATAHIRYLPVDERFKMDMEALKVQIEEDIAAGLLPFMVVGSAGTTNTGAIDPLADIAQLAKQYDLWFHVDAAYGGFFLLLEEWKPLFKGIEEADSVTIDPHKGLFLSYGLGAILMKDVKALNRAHSGTGDYMQDAADFDVEWSPADLSPELTKHFRGLRMWLPLQLYGLAPFRAALEEKVMLCRYFYKKIQELGFVVGPKPECSVTIYRYIPEEGDPNAFNQQLVEYVRRDGRIFLSSTTIGGVFWIRLAVLSFRTHLKEINTCLEVLRRGVKNLERQHSSVSNAG